MKYDVILFDADGTLLDFLRSEDEGIREALSDMNIEADDQMIAQYSIINDGLWKMLERGEIEKDVLVYRRFELFFERYGIDADAKKMSKAYMNRLSTKGHLIDGAKELCAALEGKAKLYIVTNGVAFIQKGRMEVCGIKDYFDKIFISGEVGVEKPDIRYFERVAEQIEGFSKNRAVIVGDSLTSDIKGGINFGIDTCWYNPRAKTAPDDMKDKITATVRDYGELYDFLTCGE